MMRFELLSLLAAVPSAVAGMAATAYTPPAKLLAKVQQTAGCTLPADYHIKRFVAMSNSTSSAAPLAAYNFTFSDKATKITTFCQFNSSSVSTTPSGLTPRFACENKDIKFIWTNDKTELTLIERVCPGSDGIPDYEVSGSVRLFLSCAETGACVANATEYESKYSSISPVRDPTWLARHWLS